MGANYLTLQEGPNGIFGFPIFIKKIQGTILNNIKKDVNHYIKQNPNNFDYPWPCSTKSDIRTNKSLENLNIEKLIKEGAEEYCKVFQFQNVKLFKPEYWVNIAQYGGWQEGHRHIDNFKKNIFSGVMYLDPPKDCGVLRLHHPYAVSMAHMLRTTLAMDKLITPEDGLMVFFPSWLKHEALPNNSNQDRISISWNISANVNR